MSKRIFLANLISISVFSAIVGPISPVQAISYNFQFDNTADGTLTPPIVGTGTFSFDGDPANGDYSLTSLVNFNFSFNFTNGNTFSNANITTPQANVIVRISTSGSDRFVNFGGSGGGTLGGSLDFVNGATSLSFAPNFATLYLNNTSFGTYSGIAATPVPLETDALPLVFSGLFVGGGLWLKRKRSQAKVSEFIANKD